MELHLHYEEVAPYPGVEVTGAESGNFRVQKMKFVMKGDKSQIQYNASITVASILAKASEYVIGHVNAIEWVMECYAVTIDKVSGIKSDPSAWADEYGNPRYTLIRS